MSAPPLAAVPATADWQGDLEREARRRLDSGEREVWDALEEVIREHPVLLNRPIVVTPKGVRLCRPPELVRDLLPDL